MRRGIVALVGIVACAMVTSVVLYVDGAAFQHISTHDTPTGGGTTVTLDVVSIQTTTASLSATSSSGPTLPYWTRRLTVSSKTLLWQSHPPRRRQNAPGRRECFPAFSLFH
jgi:hypothetical protein